jgi:hypothetical protein
MYSKSRTDSESPNDNEFENVTPVSFELREVNKGSSFLLHWKNKNKGIITEQKKTLRRSTTFPVFFPVMVKRV